MRPIDADAILPKMESTFDMQELYLPIHFMDLIIDNMPTLQPKQAADTNSNRKQGKWVKRGPRIDGYQLVTCPECEFGIRYESKLSYKYCPCCGTRLDGE